MKSRLDTLWNKLKDLEIVKELSVGNPSDDNVLSEKAVLELIRDLDSPAYEQILEINEHKQDTNNPHRVTKRQVGLGSVTDDAQVKRSEMGVSNGVATLGEDGKVPSSQLPSYVDDVIDVYATYTKDQNGNLTDIVLYQDSQHTVQIQGESGKIYQTVDSPYYQFRWTGTVFANISSSSLSIGETAGTAYDGEKGKINANRIAEIEKDLYGENAIDLGLTSGTLWADRNIGATDIYDGGKLFQWGDPTPYDVPEHTNGTINEGQKMFSWSDYKWNPSGDSSTFTKYNETDGKITLDPEDDAAHVNMGGTWKMPTKEQVIELFKETTQELYAKLTEDSDPVKVANGVYNENDGYVSWTYIDGHTSGEASGKLAYIVLTSKTNGNFLVVPSSVVVNDGYVGVVGNGGFFWSSSVDSGIVYGAWYGYFDDIGYGVGDYGNRCVGVCVRGVKAQSTPLIDHPKQTDNPHNVTKEQVGLGNVDNTSDMDKPVSTAQQEMFDEIGLIFDDLTSMFISGKHNQILTAEKTDSYTGVKWKYITDILNLEDLWAYGVEWDENIADPHLTRIGNMSYHRTLPIQSQLKGCIAQGDKVIYWLNPYNWKWRQDELPITWGYQSETINDQLYHEIGFKKSDVANLTFDVVTFNMNADITNPGGLECEVYKDTEHPDGWFSDETDSSVAILKIKFLNADQLNMVKAQKTSVLYPARLDGYDGTVRVYCPEFYIKSKILGTKRQVWISPAYIDSSWTKQEAVLIDAYRSTVLNTVPENMGYLSTLPVNSAISVVNTATYCRGGGDRSNYDEYLNRDIFITDLGKPRTDISRATMRTDSRNAGSEMLSYDQYKNIFYWLYVVEYANFNCQEAYNAELTDDGYHQGGLGNGVTNVSNWQAFNDYYPITPCGYGNDLGNGTGVKLITSPGLTPANGVYMCRWRGFDNPFGDIWTNLDGIIIDADADNHPNNMNYVYTCQDPEKYADNLNGEGYEKVGEEVHQDGYTKLFDLGDAAHIIPNVMGGNTTQYKCDYHWTGSKNTTLRTLIVGGGASDGAYAGLGYFDSEGAVSDSVDLVGFRSVSRFLSFSSQE